MRPPSATQPKRQRLRCAIYTRKSTEEGLDQEFNSLDAQREACAAYIASQRQEGWVMLPDRYDDGGFSGGNMERPGLQRLLADVRSGKVDVIIVYKVDRLTRSLTDFAKIVEALDAAGASFVSVTQAFNTTTSMGRLTLNVLLSFAQFEREVISERVRDKVAASKAKGMWMGGAVPLGYDARDRKLVINPAEAEIVRHIMRRYYELGSVRELMADLQGSGIHTKQQRMRDGRLRGGGPFVRGPLYHLLKNRIYVGEIVHHGRSYPGEHEAIVERALFDQVQALLAKNAADRRRGGQAAQRSLLAGLIRDGQDRPLSPSHATKPAGNGAEGSKVRYRYYVSNDAVPGEGAARIVRLPALPLERAVVEAVGTLLDRGEPIDLCWRQVSGATLEKAMCRARSLAAQFASAGIGDQRALLQALDLQIVVEDGQVVASCSRARLFKLVELSIESVVSVERVPIVIPTMVRRWGKELRLRFDPPDPHRARHDLRLIGLIARAHAARWRLIEKAPADALARRDLTRLARLSYLAPDITAAILEGRQPKHLSSRRLSRIGTLPLSWMEQRQLLGFA